MILNTITKISNRSKSRSPSNCWIIELFQLRNQLDDSEMPMASTAPTALTQHEMMAPTSHGKQPKKQSSSKNLPTKGIVLNNKIISAAVLH